MLLSFLSSLCSQSLKKLSSFFHNLPNVMVWNKRRNHISSFSSLYPLPLYNLYSFGCLPTIIDVSLALTAECQLHVDISHSSSDHACLLQIFWYLLFLLPVIVFLILCFLCTQTQIIQNPLLLSPETNLHYMFSFSLSITFSIALSCF